MSVGCGGNYSNNKCWKSGAYQSVALVGEPLGFSRNHLLSVQCCYQMMTLGLFQISGRSQSSWLTPQMRNPGIQRADSIFIEKKKNPHLSRPAQFKLMFQGQLHIPHLLYPFILGMGT